MTTSDPASAGRRGRRPGASTTRQEILESARTRFAADGFAATTIRQVATDAGVDPSLVMQTFGSKDDLFAAVMSFPSVALDRFRDAFDHRDDRIGERVVRTFLDAWEGPAEASDPLMAMLRSAVVTDRGRSQLRDFIESRLRHGPPDAADRAEDAVVRAGLVSAMLVGVIVGRRVVQVPALADLERERLIALLAPPVQALLAPADRP